jgi:hypothetical protein
MKTEAVIKMASVLTADDKGRVDQYRTQHRVYAESKGRLADMKARRSELNDLIGRLEGQLHVEDAVLRRAMDAYATGEVESSELERVTIVHALKADNVEYHRDMARSLEAEIEVASKALDRERHLVGQARTAVMQLEPAAYVARCGEFDIPFTLV